MPFPWTDPRGPHHCLSVPIALDGPVLPLLTSLNPLPARPCSSAVVHLTPEPDVPGSNPGSCNSAGVDPPLSLQPRLPHGLPCVISSQCGRVASGLPALSQCSSPCLPGWGSGLWVQGFVPWDSPSGGGGGKVKTDQCKPQALHSTAGHQCICVLCAKPGWPSRHARCLTQNIMSDYSQSDSHGQ